MISLMSVNWFFKRNNIAITSALWCREKLVTVAKTLLLVMILVGLSAPVVAKKVRETGEISPPVMRFVSNAQLVGSERFEYLFWDVYDAYLYAPDGQYLESEPYALELRYLRELDGEDIAKRSLDEMQGQGLKDKQRGQDWLEQMTSIFPNVKKGDRLLGVSDEQNVTHFFYNGEPVGKVEDEDFSRWFFGIWLSENTSEPAFRKALLNIK